MCEVEVLDEDDDDDDVDSGSSSVSAAGGGGGGGGEETHRSVGGVGVVVGENHSPNDDSDTIHMSHKRGSRVSKGPSSFAPITSAFGSSLPRADPLLKQVI